jgi:non-ribosomal peptide synthetase component F
MDFTNTSPASACLHHLFEVQAAARPDAIAVTYEGRHVSYADLDSRGNCIAHALRSRGVTRESLVGLCVEREVELVAAILGILKAGGVYVPLDPASPQERLELLLSDSAASIVVTTRALASRFPDVDRRRLILLDDVSKVSPLTSISAIEPVNGSMPVNSSNSMMPTAYTSDAAVAGSPRACSGAM